MNIPNTNKYETKPISNGTCSTSTGVRQVLTSSSFGIRPVLKCVYSGYQPDRGSLQVGPVKGDLLFKCVWGHGSDPDGDYSIWQFDGESFREVPLMDQGILWKTAQKAIPWLEEFVAPHSRQSSFIPYEGDTIVEAAKRRRLERFFDRFNIPLKEGEIEEFMRSAKADLRLDPRKEDLSKIIPESYHWDGSLVDIDRFDHWYSVSDKGTERLQVTPDETWGSNWAYSSPTEYSTGKPVEVPPGAKLVIRIGYGQHTHRGSTHYSYGRSIDVFDVS